MKMEENQYETKAEMDDCASDVLGNDPFTL